MSNAKEDGHMGWKMENSISEMNSVKGYNDGTADEAPNSSLRDLQDWFWANGSLPASDGTTNGYEMSSMRGASCLQVSITTNQESASPYQNSNNGAINITIAADSVNYTLPAGTIASRSPAATSTKNYGFSKDGGSSYQTQENDNTRTYSGLNSGNYTVIVKDFAYASVFDNSTVSTPVVVTYNGGTRTYNNRFATSPAPVEPIAAAADDDDDDDDE